MNQDIAPKYVWLNIPQSLSHSKISKKLCAVDIVILPNQDSHLANITGLQGVHLVCTF